MFLIDFEATPLATTAEIAVLPAVTNLLEVLEFEAHPWGGGPGVARVPAHHGEFGGGVDWRRGPIRVRGRGRVRAT